MLPLLKKVPAIQTIHNFRLLCPAATFYRDGHVCQDCLHQAVPLSGVIHACYRVSRLASGTVAAMLTVHRLAGTWQHKIHTYIALTEFAKGKLIEGGLPPEKIRVKPSFVPADPGLRAGAGGYVLFLGRLCEEKGVRTLLRAWEFLPDVPLKIAGDGPLRELVLQAAARLKQVTWLGHCPRAQVVKSLQEADLLVIPSEWYEALPLTLVEATACGTPVVVSQLGSLEEWSQNGLGLSFRPGDAADLARQVQCLIASPQELGTQRTRMRSYYESHYKADDNYHALMRIYQQAIETYRA